MTVTAKELQQATCCDRLLGRVFHYTKSGWPSNFDNKLFYNCKDEFTIENNCFSWGIHVVIPTKLQERVLTELHKTHLGISIIKTITKSHVWWSSLDKSIEEVCKTCQVCQEVKPSSPTAPMYP